MKIEEAENEIVVCESDGKNFVGRKIEEEVLWMKMI